MRTHTTLELLPCGKGFYCAHREDAPQKPAIALRADFDALATPDGGAAHLCGHDGHAASLCAAALEPEGKTVGRNVFLLFQPAEETGAGAGPCCELFQTEHMDEIYGAHNLPGFPAGVVFTRPGTFACASGGVTLRAEHNVDPEKLRTSVLGCAKALCEEAGLGFSFEEQDVFPATENDGACADKVLSLTGGRVLNVPMRWSEDFGHYLLHIPGAFFGIGAGEHHAPLHTARYEYPDSLLEPTANAFWALIQGA